MRASHRCLYDHPLMHTCLDGWVGVGGWVWVGAFWVSFKWQGEDGMGWGGMDGVHTHTGRVLPLTLLVSTGPQPPSVRALPAWPQAHQSRSQGSC